jgi:iron complex transport system ATP-binding protein
MIEASRITLESGPVRLLSGVSLRVDPGEFVAIVGPNGAGKSSLLSVLSGERHPSSGALRLDGRPIGQWRAQDLARRRAVMFQNSVLAFPFTVVEVVALGGGAVAVPTEVLQRAMRLARVAELAQRLYTTLSGGERQRVHFARALVQVHAAPAGQAPFLLLDEPTSSLDPGHQHALLAAARSWMAESGGAVVAVLHDLSLAARYGDRAVLLSKGEVRWQGGAAAIPVGVLEAVYGLSFRRIEISGEGSPYYASVPNAMDLPRRNDNDNYYHKVSGKGRVL